MITSKQAIELEDKYGAHNYHPLPVVLSQGQGVFLWSPEGNRYFDFLAGYGAVNQGHCHPRIVDVFCDQARRLTLTSRAFHSSLLGVAEKYLAEYFGYQKVLMMNSGAEANETALKIARKWGYEKKGVPANQAVIVAAEKNFHGRTIAMVSASTDPNAKDGFGPYLPGFNVIPYDNLQALETALSQPNVVGFWVEPIQGEAGVYVPQEGYLKKAAELCRKNNVLLMMDEIQTGLGRTGKKLACDYEDVRPDLLILGKSLSGGMMPISVVLADDNVMMVLKPGQHGSTYGGNPLASRVVIESIKVIEEERLIQNSTAMGILFRKRMEQLKDHPMVKKVRGKGLMNAVEIEPFRGKSAMDICLKLRDSGLLAKPTHDHIIRFTPPLIITESQIQESCDIIEKVMRSFSA